MNQKKKKKGKEISSFALFVIPAFVFVTISTVVPFLMNLYYSLTNWDGVSSSTTFIGIKNYLDLLKDESFWQGPVSFTLRFTIAFVILVNIFSILMAMLLTQNIRSVNILRASFYIPQTISMIMVGYTWKFILGNGFEDLYAKTSWSIFNMSWLGDQNLAFWTVVLLTIWQQAGFFCVIYIAGFQSLPEDIMESAALDGAKGLKKFFYVTLPLLMPSVTVCMFTSILNALKIYDLPFVLTAGGPAGSTRSIAMDIYSDCFQHNLYGYGTTKSVFYFVVVVIFTMISLATTKKREVEA